MDEKDTSIKNIFDKGVKFSEKVLTFDSEKKLEDNIETDEQFVADLEAIVEHSATTSKAVFAKRANLSES